MFLKSKGYLTICLTNKVLPLIHSYCNSTRIWLNHLCNNNGRVDWNLSYNNKYLYLYKNSVNNLKHTSYIVVQWWIHHKYHITHSIYLWRLYSKFLKIQIFEKSSGLQIVWATWMNCTKYNINFRLEEYYPLCMWN